MERSIAWFISWNGILYWLGLAGMFVAGSAGVSSPRGAATFLLWWCVASTIVILVYTTFSLLMASGISEELGTRNWKDDPKFIPPEYWPSQVDQRDVARNIIRILVVGVFMATAAWFFRWACGPGLDVSPWKVWAAGGLWLSGILLNYIYHDR